MDDFDVRQRVLDLVADLDIRRLMYEYAATIDARDWSRLRAVLADDVVVEFHNGRTVVSGADAVVAYVDENTRHLAWQHHTVSPYAIDCDGDRAMGRSYLISHQMIAADPRRVLIMAAYYDTEYIRTTDGWRIARMVHTITMTNFAPLTSTPPDGVPIPPPVAP